MNNTSKGVIIAFIKKDPVGVILKESDGTWQYYNYKANPKYCHNKLSVLINNLVFNKIADIFRLVKRNPDTKQIDLIQLNL